MSEPMDQKSNATDPASAARSSSSKVEASFTADAVVAEQLEPTPTVTGALKRLGPDKPTSAAAFAQAILEGSDHRDKYAGGLFRSLELEETDEKRSAQAWLDDVQTLFDPKRLKKHFGSLALHGRLVIIGLALLDGQLYRQLESDGGFTGLVQELQPPLGDLADILTDRGREFYDRLPPAPLECYDTVPSWPDDPLEKPEQDLLGRAAFARFLAKRIAVVPAGSGAYVLHLYGAWGAGKSSVLNFLRDALEGMGDRESGRERLMAQFSEWRAGKSSVSSLLRAVLEEMGDRESGEGWLVVEFNAWRNQRIDPPWWSLMDAVFQQTKKRLSPLDRLQEYWWRLMSGRLVYIFAAVILAWLLVLAIGWAQEKIIAPPDAESQATGDVLDALAGSADNLSKIFALIVTVWGGIVGFNRSLLLGSAGAAKNYKERTRDPMNEIRERFNTLIDRLDPWRVVVFIDDLDRCQGTYVVELLEGIQTLFREAPVVYVVAADRRWLNACYEQVYEKLKSQISEPGKSLGMLFLEKAFRFSTPLPGIPEELKKQYWAYLLQLKSEEQEVDWDGARSTARETASRAAGEGELQELARPSTVRSFVEQQAMREEVAVRLAHPDVMERLEHTLQPYAKLQEPNNPRAMKRFVNAYSASRALAILSGADIERHQLALWIILTARWPQLAADLEDSPKTVEQIGLDADPKASSILRDPDVIHVVGGGDIGPRLSRETIEECASMHA